MTKPKCSVDGCSRPTRTRTWCAGHYGRWRRTGTTGGPTLRPITTNMSEPTLRSYINENSTPAPGGCRDWAGSIDGAGYGNLVATVGGERFKKAHRISYRVFKGEIPAGLMIDHICHNRACVNPEHLRAVSNMVNVQNRVGASAASKSRVRGVSWSKKNKRWVVQAWSNGEYHWGGQFDEIGEAERAAVALRARVHAVTSRPDAEYLRNLTRGRK